MSCVACSGLPRRGVFALLLFFTCLCASQPVADAGQRRRKGKSTASKTTTTTAGQLPTEIAIITDDPLVKLDIKTANGGSIFQIDKNDAKTNLMPALRPLKDTAGFIQMTGIVAFEFRDGNRVVLTLSTTGDAKIMWQKDMLFMMISTPRDARKDKQP